MKYTGQTGRPFKVRFQENLQDFKYKSNKSKFAQRLIDNKHAIGPMEDIMEVVHVTKKGKLMGTLECFHIYKETKAGNLINDRLKAKENAMFETIIQKDPYKGRSAHRSRAAKRNQLWEAIHPRRKRKLHRDRSPFTTARKKPSNLRTNKKKFVITKL